MIFRPSKALSLLFLFLIIFSVASVYQIYKKPAVRYSKTLIVYSYPSFLNAWGPGPELVKEFELHCECKIQLVEVADSSLILQKLRLNRDKRVDLIIGLDQLHLQEASENFQWQDLTEFKELLPEREIPYPEFIPIDWAPLTFIYRKSELKNPPQNLDDLLKPEYKAAIALQDPRTSTPGLQFLSWVSLAKKEGATDYLKKLKPNIHSASPSWSTSYGLFKKKQAKLVFSYLTSPVYHWVEDKDEDYQPTAFKERLPMQYEWVAIPESSDSVFLAKEFVRYLISPPAQKIIMEKSYMFPVIDEVMVGTIFGQLPIVKTFSLHDYFRLDRKELLDLWSKIQH